MSGSEWNDYFDEVQDLITRLVPSVTGVAYDLPKEIAEEARQGAERCPEFDVVGFVIQSSGVWLFKVALPAMPNDTWWLKRDVFIDLGAATKAEIDETRYELPESDLYLPTVMNARAEP